MHTPSRGLFLIAGIDGHASGQGERVEVTLHNRSEMSHSMNLHGQVFQVVAINGERFAGLPFDSMLVSGNTMVTLAFYADCPGRWAFRCHNLYHMAVGMMTLTEYIV